MDTMGNVAGRLTLLASSGADAQKILEAAYEYVHRPLAFTDNLLRPIAFFGPGVVVSDCERHNDSDPVLRNAWHARVQASDEPVIDENNGGRYRAMCLDVRYAGIAVGKLAMMETRPFEQEDRSFMKLLAGVLALQYMGDRIEISTHLDIERSQLLQDLIRGTYSTTGLQDTLSWLGIPEDRSMCMMALRVKLEEHAKLRRGLMQFFDAICLIDEHVLLCLTGMDEYMAQQEAVISLVSECNAVCGVSAPFEGFTSMHDRAEQAKASLETALRRGVPLVEYKDCRIDDIIAICTAARDPRTFCRSEILDLARHDDEHGTEYLKTFKCYLQCMCSRKETASMLYLHTNTIKYRLNAIFALIGTESITSQDLCEYLLSIRILERER